MIPTYILTGFLGSGKTTLLNKLLAPRRLGGKKHLLVQFESGEVSFYKEAHNSDELRENVLRWSPGFEQLDVVAITKRSLDRDFARATSVIRDTLQAAERVGIPYDCLWIEWNGMGRFSELYQLFTDVFIPSQGSYRYTGLADLCRVESVIHLIDAGRYEALMTTDGSPLPEQIREADVVVVRGDGVDRIRQSIKRIMPRKKVIQAGSLATLKRTMGTKSLSSTAILLIATSIFLLFWLGLRPLFQLQTSELESIAVIFLSILLQGLPFLTLGVLIASAIQIFVPAGFLEKYFPVHPLWSFLFALFAGFFLPVCDCASIPVFHSLVKKGVPLPAAVTFMAASPIVNPVVILSTWYAFGGGPMVVARLIGGLALGLMVGLIFFLITKGYSTDVADGIMPRSRKWQGSISEGTVKNGQSKWVLLLQHIKWEFFSVARYLIVAALLSALVQTLLPFEKWFAGTKGVLPAVLLMMAAAFLLSLCSSSDAMVVQSLAFGFPPAAMFAFLLFGPVIDLKNVIMLKERCSYPFIMALVLTTAAVVLALTAGFYFLKIDL